jgi:hypothetical protein
LLAFRHLDEDGIRQISKKIARRQFNHGLEELSTTIGPRLSGSSGAKLAVEWGKKRTATHGDSVWLQPVMVPQWVRGQKEVARIKKSKSVINVCALEVLLAPDPGGVTGEVVEVKNLEELKLLGEEEIKGKIVFFNRPMDPAKIQTFSAYGGAVDQRGSGPSKLPLWGNWRHCAVYGTKPEDYPHTGALSYEPSLPKIPAVAISTKHADQLSKSLQANEHLQFYFETHCAALPDVQSFNVIGEIKGSEYPNEIIVVSGHLDSWDLGQGAHDDGAGVVHAMEVLRLFKGVGN